MCEDGYTLSFHFRNELPPQQWIDKGLFPIHARVLGLLDCVTESHHRVGMDNLYTSVKFAKVCFNHPKKVLISGMIRKGMRDVPNCVIREEQKTMKRQEEQRGKKKDSILVGNSSCSDMICTSVYDTKPVHFISMYCDNISWVVNGRKVWSKIGGQFMMMKFLRFNQFDKYNFEMNDVGVTDQLRLFYRFDVWIWNHKWW